MRTVDKFGNELVDPDLSKGYLREAKILKSNAPKLSDDHPCYVDDDFERGYIYFEGNDFFKRVHIESEKKVKKEEKLNQIADLIQTKIEQSDKLGYIWKCIYIGDICVSKEHVKDPNVTGTKNKPIIWKPGVQLIPNAFYVYKNNIYVYVDENSKADSKFDFSKFEKI